MIIAEPDNERKDREEKADHLRRVNYGRRNYIDQFTSTDQRDWELIKKIIRGWKNES